MTGADTPQGHDSDPGDVCPKCGEPHDQRHCTGHARSGKQCGRPAGWGTDHVGYGACKLHLGSTESHRKHGESLMLQADIAETFERYQLDPDAGDALVQLVAAVRTAGAMRRIYSELVGSLAPHDMLLHSEKGSATHPFVTELRAWTTDTARVAKQALDAGIAEREVKVLEQQAELLGHALKVGIELAIRIVGGIVDDAAVVRQVNAQLPSIMRQAIEEAARIIDTTGTEDT